MTADEKTQLYRFLAVAERFLCGYYVPAAEPAFTDDSEPLYDSLGSIDKAVSSCRLCALSENRTSAVRAAGIGNRPILAMVVSFAPSTSDQTTGIAFSGPEGDLLDRMLSAIALSRGENCVLTHLLKCPISATAPKTPEIAACSPYLDAQIALSRPAMILALGEEAAKILSDTTDPLTVLRGKVLTSRGIPVMATYSPTDLLADETLKRPVWEDLKRFRAELDRRAANAPVR